MTGLVLIEFYALATLINAFILWLFLKYMELFKGVSLFLLNGELYMFPRLISKPRDFIDEAYVDIHEPNGTIKRKHITKLMRRYAGPYNNFYGINIEEIANHLVQNDRYLRELCMDAYTESRLYEDGDEILLSAADNNGEICIERLKLTMNIVTPLASFKTYKISYKVSACP